MPVYHSGTASWAADPFGLFPCHTAFSIRTPRPRCCCNFSCFLGELRVLSQDVHSPHLPRFTNREENLVKIWISMYDFESSSEKGHTYLVPNLNGKASLPESKGTTRLAHRYPLPGYLLCPEEEGPSTSREGEERDQQAHL
ncbi:unnamed protein product [Rangifer tarandus platyrhynchus]|uniref:Uncharacterized protein n=1 Tax=Rangifer tarandus platyrhynchus TaxID=3082113 RepID=A0AC59Z060_RANTA